MLGVGDSKVLLGFYLNALALALACAVVAGLGPLSIVPLGLFGLHLVWQAWALKVDDPAGALRLFRANREAGLLLLAALVFGLWHLGGSL